MRLFRKTQKEHAYTVAGLTNGWRGGGGGGGRVLYPGGLISGIIYSLTNGWAYIWGKGGGLKTRGALNWDFTVVELEFI